MVGQVRVGVIGTSWWADFTHLPLFKADPRAELIAICGRNRERAQEMADKYAIPNVFSDYHEMIAKGNLHAVVISTPDDEHFPMTMATLEAGLHVLCEKPLALNASDAKTMYDTAQAKGVRHMTFFTWRWMPHYRYIRELLDQGVVGNPYHLQLNFLMGFARTPQYQWRFDQRRANGVLGDSGSHMFDLARYLVGDIARVNARLVVNVPRDELNGQPTTSACDAATVLVEFSNGSRGSIELSAVTRVDDEFLEQQFALHGDAGSVVSNFGLMSPLEVRLSKGDEGFQTLTIPDKYLEGLDISQPIGTQMLSLFTQQPIACRLFIDAILKDQAIEPTFYEGWKVQQVIEAAITSHQSGRWIDV
jgi:predicted dehydrogenase